MRCAGYDHRRNTDGRVRVFRIRRG
ncbi:MAG: DUF4224 domain-containing protein [Verrucomicrobiae bacterium]|nr:DUF4224 domain-containing protein [Verrucomicrobiae bacterium]